jgi:hypothetical protein
MSSGAPFRDAKAKLMEIRQKQSKRSDRTAGGDERRRKKHRRCHLHRADPWTSAEEDFLFYF